MQPARTLDDVPLPDEYTVFSWARGPVRIPERAPVLLIQDAVVFPRTLTLIHVNSAESKRVLKAIGEERYPSLATLLPEAPLAVRLFSRAKVGCVARAYAVRTEARDAFGVLLDVGERVGLSHFEDSGGLLTAKVQAFPDSERAEAPYIWPSDLERLRDAAYVAARGDLQDATLARELTSVITDPIALAGMGICALGWSVERQQALVEVDGPERVAQVLEALWSRP